MRIQIALQSHFCEKEYSEHSKQKQEQEKQCTDICKLRDRQEKHVQDLLQTLSFPDKFQYSENSKGSNYSLQSTKLYVENYICKESNPGENHDEEIENVPVVFEVVFLVGDKFYDHLNSVNHCESYVNILHDLWENPWLSNPGHWKANRVKNDADKNKIFEAPALSNITTEISESVSSLHKNDLRVGREALL